MECKSGQTIIYEDSTVTGIYFIYSGKVKITKGRSGSNPRILRLASKGNILGHRGYGNDQMKYPISASALEDVQLCFFSNEKFFELVQHNAKLGFNLMMFYATELKNSENRVYQQIELTAKQRFVATINEMIEQFGLKSGKIIDVPMTRRELASYCGITYETCLRNLSDFKKAKALEYVGTTAIKVLDRKAFQE